MTVYLHGNMIDKNEMDNQMESWAPPRIIHQDVFQLD